MPTIPPKDYLTKIDEFIAHWTQVNATLGSPIILTGNYGLASLQSDRDDLADEITALEAAINTNQGAISDRDVRRAAVKERMRQFSQLVRGAFPKSRFERMLPRAPGLTSAPGRWMKAMADVQNIWALINAVTPVPVGAPIPLILTGGYTLANFGTDQAALNAAFTAVDTTESVVSTAVQRRDAVWDPIYERLRQYRLAVQGRFPAGAPLLESLPRLTPPPGSTPAPVTASGGYDEQAEEGFFTYTASTHPTLQEYELRISIGGTKYNSNTAFVAGNNAPTAPREFRTASGLVAPGSRIFGKVYVISTTGNERGSNTVTITRP